MPVRRSEATWEGTLKEGRGTVSTESGAYEGEFRYATRFGDEEGTNPEELIAAAHAGCFSMALSNALDGEGYDPVRIHTEAKVHLEGGAITLVELATEAEVRDVDEETFLRIARDSKANCPVSKALAAVDIELDATLL